jgi:hypothetical protein
MNYKLEYVVGRDMVRVLINEGNPMIKRDRRFLLPSIGRKWFKSQPI